MDKGYMGKVLFVDLTTQEITEEPVPDDVYRRFLSGVGLAAYLLYRRIPAGADPLGPDNIIGFVSGLLTGTSTLFTGRWMAVGKSPLTGTWGDANCGGTFSPAIKKCGYDGIFFSGASPNPVYLYIDNRGPKLRDASELWGMDAIETENTLIRKLGSKRIKTACIGPAGENMSLISGISNDKGRMAARSGLGAVMGSKKLKAVVLNGTGKIKAYNRKEIKRLRLTALAYVRVQPKLKFGVLNAYLGGFMRKIPYQMFMDGIIYQTMLKKWGTISVNQFGVEMGDTPVKNWKGTNEDFNLKKSKNINPDRITKFEIKKYFCYSCPLGCGGICSMKHEKYKTTHKPEYETVLALSGLLMNEDIDSIFYLNEILNRAGMDTISAGHTVAFAFECYEQGIITKKDTDGLELTWGNTDAVLQLVEKMIRREGIGDLLADGVKVAAKKLGKGSERYAMHSGGQELAMHDGRNDPGYALHYNVEPTPGRHTMGSQIYYDMFQLWKKIDSLPRVKFFITKDSKYVADEEKAIKAAACSKFMNFANGIGLCLFGAFLGVHRLPVFEWVNAANAWDKTPEEYMEIGAAIQTLKQQFNVKHGIDPKKIKANERTVGRPIMLKGANKGRSLDIEKMTSDYWKLFDWDADTGKPVEETIKKLGIEE